MRFLCVVILWFVFGIGQAFAEKLAVLEFQGLGMSDSELKVLTDSARGGALEVGRGEGIDIYTRENMLMMLKDMGVTSECMEGSCEVELARNISADYVVSGKVTKSESYWILQLKLHETKGGTLLATEEFEATDQQSLRRSVKPKTEHLLRSGLGLSGGGSVVAIEEARLSDDVAVRLMQLERQRTEMRAAQQAREDELARQLAEQRRYEAVLSQAEAEAKRPYQEKAQSDWQMVSAFAATKDPMGKAALELFIAEYNDVRVKVGSKEMHVDIPELETAHQVLSMYRFQAYEGYDNWSFVFELDKSSAPEQTTEAAGVLSASACVDCQKEGHLAVLEFSGGLRASQLVVLTDSARSSVLDLSRGSGIEIYTRENMLLMIKDRGQEPACIEGSCEVELARNMSADYVISGKVTKSEGLLLLQLKLHETRRGTLLAMLELEGADFNQLRRDTALKSGVLLQSGLGLAGGLSGMSVEVEGMSGQLLSALEQLQQERKEMMRIEQLRLADLEQRRLEQAERTRLLQAELDRQRLDRERLALLQGLEQQRLEELQLQAMVPYQEKAAQEWTVLKAAAKQDYKANKAALADFISRYQNIEIVVEGRSIVVNIQEVAEAKQAFRFGLHEGFETVDVSGGTFMMGCVPTDGKCDVYEKSRHKVTISYDMEVMKTEVTQKMYQDLMGYNPSKFKGGNRPVEQVHWYSAVAFANALSRKEGLPECYWIIGEGVDLDVIEKQLQFNKPPYNTTFVRVFWMDKECTGWRLPTEAEWEYVARGGAEYIYSGSRNPDEVAWTKENSGALTHVGGLKKPNGFGVYDMTGNVYEWCWDKHRTKTYSRDPVTDPQGAVLGQKRVYRGGSWNSSLENNRVSYRGEGSPDTAYSFYGFRLFRRKASSNVSLTYIE